jgi:predicted PurR-regulated permease PerM
MPMNAQSSSGVRRVVMMLSMVMLIVAALHFGRELLIPLAMAVLLTFLTTPLVKALERLRLPRVPAVLIAIVVIFCVMVSAGWVIGAQLRDLANRLPVYQENLRVKLEGFRISDGAIANFEETLSEVGAARDSQGDSALPVRVVPDKTSAIARLQPMFSAMTAPLANMAMVLVLAIFMLISREDLRNRLVRLAGTRLALTTRTLDEVGSRISGYLVLNALVNGGFGLAIAIGLSLIGVDYAITWGFLAAILRFVPYIGPILASGMPIGIAFMQFPGHDWIHPALVAGLFIVLELITNNVIEPITYGSRTGVSTVALLVATMFWTWVWGPLGLVLAVPLTVMLAVLGEHVAALEPLAILLGDKPALSNHITYYQRLLAGDTDEAYDILEAETSSASPIEAYDTILIPALVLAEKDRDSGELLEAEQQAIWESTREFMEEMPPANWEDAQLGIQARVMGCPAHDLADEMALLMLKQSCKLSAEGEFQILPVTMLVSEMLATIEQNQPDVVCISSLGPIGAPQTRYMCLRIRQSFPSLRIVVGRWGYPKDREKMVQTLKKRGADQVVTKLVEARDQLQRITPLVQSSARLTELPAA